MRVMVLGAGLVGTALARGLRARGHYVTQAGRDTRAGAGTIALDFNALPDDATLVRALSDLDVLVNTVGIFRQTAQQRFAAVHVDTPLRLFAAARSAGVRRVLQVSALGADPASPVPFLASKGRADAALLAHDHLERCVVRLSLVFSPAGAGTRCFAAMAGLPLLPLPGGGRQCIQPLHLDDLVAVLVRLVEAPSVPDTLDVAGPRPLTLRAYLEEFRRAMDTGGATVPVPMWLARAGAWVAARAAPRAPLHPDALAMLAAAGAVDPAPTARWLGHAPRAPEHFFQGLPLERMRRNAMLGWSLPLMRIALALAWIGAGVVLLCADPRAAALELLARVGLQGAPAQAVLWIAALLDIALGAALLLLRRRRLLYAAQLVLVAACTIVITLRLPEQWSHPLGPVLKNLPLLAMIAALSALDRGEGPDRP